MDNTKLKKIIGNSIVDVSCPHCGEEVDTYRQDTDEIEFYCDGTGHYYVDYHCKECGKGFRVYFEFKYQITEASYYKDKLF